jgi:drug/metabolite transporter (DMT)-like permease
MMSKHKLAVSELIVATVLWGFGFIAMIWALREMSPVMITATRFMASFAICALPILYWPDLRRQMTLQNLRLAAAPGLLLGGTILLQTWGLKYTTATKSGFITTLYVLMVPILEFIVLKRRIHRLHGLFVGLALLGTAMMMELRIDGFNRGDFLTFLCAIVASVQIFWFGLIGDKIGSPFVFNTLQCLWGGLPFVLLAVFTGEKLVFWPGGHLERLGVTCLVLGSTVIGFLLQVRGQRILPPSISSLIFLLESPFAALFAIFLLGERLSLLKLSGGVLIIGSVYCASRLETAPA